MSKMEKKHSGVKQLSDPRLARPKFTLPLQNALQIRIINYVRGDKSKNPSKANLHSLRRRRRRRNERKQNKPESTCGLAAVTV